MRKWMGFAVGCAVVSMALVGTVQAHDGHSHSVMGTVAKIAAGFLEVTTADGTIARVVTTEKTTVTRGKAAARLADVAIGDRVVVDVGTGKTPVTARSIKLGTGPGSAVTASRVGPTTKPGKATGPPATHKHPEH